MQVDYELTKEDYLEFNLAHMYYSKSIRKILFFQRYVLSLVLLILPFVLKMITTIPLWYWLTAFIIVYLVWVIFYDKFMRRSFKKKVYRMLAEGNNTNMLGPHTMRLEENGLVNVGRFGETRTSYEGIERVVENDQYIFVYTSALMAYIIPKRSFANAGHQEEFTSALRAEVKSWERYK